MTLLAAENISLRRAEILVLDDVSFALNKGEFLTIVGPNGAGKTQLLKILLGIAPPTSGRVQNAQAKIGYMPQQFHPPVSLPIMVRDFLTLHKSDTQNAGDIIARTKLQDLLHKPLQSLSGGEQQYVLLARALIGAPDFLVLDEPAQNLDIAAQAEFYALLTQLYEQEKFGVLMVSHDLHFVMSASQRVICLYQHICCAGTPQAVSADPHFVKFFGKELATQLARYEHQHNHTHER